MHVHAPALSFLESPSLPPSFSLCRYTIAISHDYHHSLDARNLVNARVCKRTCMPTCMQTQVYAKVYANAGVCQGVCKHLHSQGVCKRMRYASAISHDYSNDLSHLHEWLIPLTVMTCRTYSNDLSNLHIFSCTKWWYVSAISHAWSESWVITVSAISHAWSESWVIHEVSHESFDVRSSETSREKQTRVCACVCTFTWSTCNIKNIFNTYM